MLEINIKKKYVSSWLAEAWEKDVPPFKHHLVSLFSKRESYNT